MNLDDDNKYYNDYIWIIYNGYNMEEKSDYIKMWKTCLRNEITASLLRKTLNQNKQVIYQT